MAGFEVVGLSLACVLLVVSIFGPAFAPQLTSVLGITIDATPLVLYFFIFATVYNAILLTTIGLQDKKKWFEGQAHGHVFTVMIPCRNEDKVIRRTVQSIMNSNYPKDKLEILAIDDGSLDETGRILESLRPQYPNLRVLSVPPADSGKGKSAALNKGYAYLKATSPFASQPNWIIGVLDADGQVDEAIFSKASCRFENKKVGAVQVLVRISNAKESILTKLQDIEFVTFAKITQLARTVFSGAVALGGNGQFIRASTLESIKLSEREYWRTEALTEDLDLGTRVLLSGSENSFLSSTAVYQHGVTTFSALYKQRTRWSWGAIQCYLKYVPTMAVLKSKISLTKKLDLIYYLSATLLPPVVLIVWALSIFAMIGLFNITTPFPSYFLIANSISFFPLIGYGLWTIRKDYKATHIIPLLILTNAYTYHWVICTVVAMTRVIRRKKPHWLVTQKKAYEPEIAVLQLEEPIIIAHQNKERQK